MKLPAIDLLNRTGGSTYPPQVGHFVAVGGTVGVRVAEGVI
jgi:hypothetical protein